MSDAAREHWLDRLAAPQTRAQVLRAALAGAALTLPFARPAAGRGASRQRSQGPCNAKPGKDPKACQTGCLRTSNLRSGRQLDACEAAFNKCWTGVDLAVSTGLLLAGGWAWASLYSSEVDPGKTLCLVGFGKCIDAALFLEKSRMYDCLQDNCPGFDPCGPDGPCVDCSRVPNASCCPDTTSVLGYSCCAQCCAPNGVGCGSGVTDCGGSP
jgi:hypothetical protein